MAQNKGKVSQFFKRFQIWANNKSVLLSENKRFERIQLRTVKVTGVLILLIVVFLIGVIVFSAHYICLESWWNYSWPSTLFLLVLGYWILINLIYNFYKASSVSPGEVPDYLYSDNENSELPFCKKCKKPKPFRAHHCSYCGVCHLKMDHHCFWVNNCIGKYNHRYFYLSMAYIVVGCIYIVFVFYSISKEKIIGSFRIANNLMSLKIYDINDITNGKPIPIPEEFKYDDEFNSGLFFILITALLTFGCLAVFSVFLVYHAYLISKGLTCIEYKMRKNKKLKGSESEDKHLYDHGILKNWKIFLGFPSNGKIDWKDILWPSLYNPIPDEKVMTFDGK